ncbi:hypothetical protein BS47DRAFT_1392661 [Hydnum rufescens UP504]|uniref:DUF6534 domain-containing protein n=1 Tax=Hydnum rufescens UP504 TaxID=1448309 RepID=A0A9P6AZJ1_9AGAM|nr:hypothetical protein BS47DRAFT_1392661 [Hydnum rufescens UP504]
MDPISAQPKSHISTIIAIIIEKSNTLLYDLHSRQALRRAPSMPTTLDHAIEFPPQRRNSSSDNFTLELTTLGYIGDEPGVLGVKQCGCRKLGKDLSGGVPDHVPFRFALANSPPVVVALDSREIYFETAQKVTIFPSQIADDGLETGSTWFRWDQTERDLVQSSSFHPLNIAPLKVFWETGNAIYDPNTLFGYPTVIVEAPYLEGHEDSFRPCPADYAPAARPLKAHQMQTPEFGIAVSSLIPPSSIYAGRYRGNVGNYRTDVYCAYLSLHFLPRSALSLPFIMVVINATRVNILGGSFFGNLLTALCFGVLTIQTSSYYHSFPNEGRLVKLAAYSPSSIVKDFRSFSTVDVPLVDTVRATWEFLMYHTSTACASVTVQTFFAHRVYSLSGNLYLGVLVTSLKVMQYNVVASPCVASIWLVLPDYDHFPMCFIRLIPPVLGFAAATAIRAYASPNMILEFHVMVKECTWLAEAWLIIQAIADVVIATYMCILLRRRRTGFPKTDSVINRMVLYTISTGLITSVLSMFASCDGAFQRFPSSFQYDNAGAELNMRQLAKDGYHFSVVVIGMSLGAFYSITMLTNLNMRMRLRASLDTPTPLELIGHSIEKRIWQNAGDRRGVRRNAYIATSGG